MDKKLSELYDKGLSRRNFLVGAGAIGASAALAGCGDNNTAATFTTTGLNDVDILNFALQLEYLEAEFYLYAATGAGLSAADAGTGAGTTTVPSTGTKLTGLTTAQQNIVNEIAYDEQQHVKFLRSALGAQANARPNIDLTFFGPLAMVAGITTVATGTGSFNPFANFDSFLVGAFIFEDVGVTAYNGAAPLITAAGVASGYLAAAAGIMAVEAYHAAYVRTAITANAIALSTTTPGTGTTNATTTTSYSQFAAANKVSTLRAALGGASETPLTLPNTVLAPGTAPAASLTAPAPVYASSIVAANTSALAYARTPDQVLHIVYGSATVGTKSGGFFPSGANYRFATTTT
ncbi:MAG: ferritin-like domain-containing protein [Janthinobacterium lividum]